MTSHGRGPLCLAMLCQVAPIATALALTAFVDGFEKAFKAVRELTKGLGAAFGELYQARMDKDNSHAQAAIMQEKAVAKRQKLIAQQDVVEAKKRATSALPAAQDRALLIVMSPIAIEKPRMHFQSMRRQKGFKAAWRQGRAKWALRAFCKRILCRSVLRGS